MPERFHFLIKQRLMLEYEETPPLFPWESELREYPAEVAASCSRASDNSSASDTSSDEAALWIQNLSSLQVPRLLPKPVLNALFKQCQDIVLAPCKQGVQLVRAVESFFPAKDTVLESIASIVLLPAYRSTTGTQAAVLEQLIQLANDYDSASQEQQIALLMMAAQEVLGATTRSLSKQAPEASWEWLTAYGMLKLSARYMADADSQLTVAAMLPKNGQVRLWAGNTYNQALRSDPGVLELSCNTLDAKAYLIEVFLDSEETALKFVVKLEEPKEAGLFS